MTTLEDLIRNLAARGEISSIGLYFSPTEGKWVATFALCSKFGLTSVAHVDPCEALRLALSATKGLAPMPRAKKFDEVNPPTSEMPQRARIDPNRGSGPSKAFTAAVTEAVR